MMMRRFWGMLFLFLVVNSSSVVAQQGQPKMDTTVSDTIVVGEENTTLKTHVDTSYSAAPEAGDSATAAEESPVLRSVPDTTVHRWQRDPDYAYANDPAWWTFRRPEPSPFLLWLARVLVSPGFRYTILFLLAALLLYAIIRIAMENNVSLFYRRRLKKGAATGEDADAEEEEENIDQRIQQFLDAGDRRQATRYLYRKSLYLLRDRDLIHWHVDTTNQGYLRQLKGTPVEADFRLLTVAYEKVWYGGFVLSEAAFRVLYEHFIGFYKNLQA